jgi:hypothetical protein
MGIFSTRPPVSSEEYDWLVACFAWLRLVLDDTDIRPELVLPDHPALLSARTGPELFDAVRDLMDMSEWPCRLVKVDDDFDPGDARIQQEGTSACGTFSVEDGEAVIRYSSAMLRDPDALAATFAHELCHYLLVEAGDPPGGPDLMEHSTDCAAAYLGFGVLLANSARNFEQWTDGEWQGWRSHTAGYLSEQALVTATAMFAHLHGLDARAIEGGLKTYLRSDLRKAAKAVAKDSPNFAERLAAVDLLEWNYS